MLLVDSVMIRWIVSMSAGIYTYSCLAAMDSVLYTNNMSLHREGRAINSRLTLTLWA